VIVARELHAATRVIRAGLDRPAQGEPFMPGPVFAAVYGLSGEPATSAWQYGRYQNPTWSRFEAALGELEGGPAVAFSSGMAAVTALLTAILKPGDTLVLPSDGYYTTRLLAQEWLASLGMHVRTAPTAGLERVSFDGATLVLVESPSNPGLDVCDIARIADAAHASGTLVAIDNTTPTALGQTPLSLGADFSVASDTKALCGHGDIVLGHVASADAGRAEQLRAWRIRTGAIPGPMEVWLAHRSLATLELRLERQCANALAIATFLRGRPDVRALRYPGLEGDPAHEIARRQMRLFGPVVSFELADRAAAERFLHGCRLVTEATSFGSIHTTAERRARWGGDAIAEGFIRLSAGCEHVDDLIADLAQALDAAH
jgi:cystathionine gamma-lyase